MVVVFDVDGTIADTKSGIIAAVNAVYERMELAMIPQEQENDYIGPPLLDSFMKLGKLSEKDARHAVELYRKIYVDSFIEQSSLYVGMKDLLDFLYDRKSHMAIATMKTKAQVDRLFSVLEIEKYFENVFCAKTDNSLNKSDMLKAIKNIYSTEEIYMIGDTMGDYDAAQNAKVKFIGAGYGYGVFEQTIVSIVESVEEIIPMLC